MYRSQGDPPSTPRHRIGRVAASSVALGVLGLALAPPQQLLAADAPAAQQTAVPFGRENPFQPLISTSAAPSLAPPGVVGPPPVPLPPGLMPSARPTPPPIEMLGAAYDGPAGSDATAVVRVNGRVRFVRVGDRIDGETVTRISMDRLELSGHQHQTVVRKSLSTGARSK